MSRKIRLFKGNRSRALPWMIGLIGLICLSILARGLGNAEGERGGRVDTVLKPYAEAIEIPRPTSIAGSGTPVDPGRETAPDVSCEDLLLTVRPDHTLTPDYVPPDLVYLSAYGIPARGAEDMLRQEAAVQLASLVLAAAEDGVEVLVASGYRSYWEQEGTFEWFKEAYGEEAGKLSVPPGQSEHQLGTAVDFASSDVDYELVPAFSQTRAGVWLADHAAEYGFVLSYGEDQEADTGVSYEPWHYRYIGVDNALEVQAADEDATSFHREGAPHCYGP